MGSDYENRGDVFFGQAQKAMRSGFFSFFENKEDKARDAAELYEKAANAYKLDKKWRKVGESFVLAAEHYLSSGDAHSAARRYEDAATAYQKNDVEAALECLSSALNIYLESGRFPIAAKVEKDMAEICEANNDLKSAAGHYMKSADYHEGEGQNTNRDSNLLKAAHIHALLENYELAIENFEKIAANCVEDNLRKFSVREYLLKAGLCRLNSGDYVAIHRAFDGYDILLYNWKTSRESKLLSMLLDALENYDEVSFTKAITDYDSLSRLDPWKTSILLKVKERIKSQESEIL